MDKAQNLLNGRHSPNCHLVWAISIAAGLARIGDSRRQVAVVSLKGTVIDQGEGLVISPNKSYRH